MGFFIFAVLMGALSTTFTTGRESWMATNTQIQLQENLRLALTKVSSELRQSQVGQGQIFDGTGGNNSDVLRFSIPIICQAGGSIMGATGGVAYWGAPLTWGCTDSSCMDADDDCTTLDYAAVQYSINNNAQFIRSVLNANNIAVRNEVIARNILDFQAVLPASGVINLNMSGQLTSDARRVVTEQIDTNVYLRN